MEAREGATPEGGGALCNKGQWSASKPVEGGILILPLSPGGATYNSPAHRAGLAWRD